MIVHSTDPITLVGGAHLNRTELNISLTLAPRVVAADGGANHLLRFGVQPEAVIGDLDSLSDAARHAFKGRLHHITEQDTTDFEKVLDRVQAPLLLALGFLGGRLDHSLAVLNLLARRADQRIILIGQADIAFIAPQDGFELPLPVATRLALMPLGQARVSTAGLKWNIADRIMSPDGLVSPSNETNAPIVQLTVAGPVLVTMPPAHLPAVMSALA